MKRICLSACILLAFVLQARAQYYYDRAKTPIRQVEPQPSSTGSDFSHFFYLAWEGNSPQSNLAYLRSQSNLGFKLGFRKRLNDTDRLWVGGDFGWSYFKQYVPLETYQYGTASINTDLYNYAYNYSLTGSIDYFFLPMEKIINPYAGLGIGVAYDKFSQYYNIYSNTASSWGFLVRPEVGILVGIKENSPWRLKLAANYSYASNSATLVLDHSSLQGLYTPNNFIMPTADGNYKSVMSMGFQIGIVKMVR